MDLLASSGSLAPAVAARKADFGFALTVVLMHFWALLGAVAEFGDATTGRTSPCVLSLRGPGGMGTEGEMGEKNLGRLIEK